MTYLFNLFDFWGAVVTSRPEIKTLRDLEGKEVAAAKAKVSESDLKTRIASTEAPRNFFAALTKNPEGFVNVNPAFAAMLGYDSPADMIACCTDIAASYYVNSADRDRFLKLIAARGLMRGC